MPAHEVQRFPSAKTRAIIEITSLERDGWIFPLAAAQSKHVVPLAQQQRLYTHPGTVLSGERALTLAGVCARDVDAAELYSCFSAAIQSFARDLKLPETCPWTVTGAMPFAGGPYNSFSLEGVARMVEVLRGGEGNDGSERRIGLVSNLSGIFGKQACALFSNLPNADGYRFEDVTAQVAACDLPLPLDGDYVGPAAIVGYTVVFVGGVPCTPSPSATCRRAGALSSAARTRRCSSR